MFTIDDAHDLIMTFVYSVIGLVIFGLFFVTCVKVMPFPVIKEIEEDQNVALAIVMGSALVGLSIIIAAAIV